MEAKLENKLRLKVKALGGFAWKWVSPGTTGVPDRIVLMPGGRIYFVEMKWGKNGLSAQQKLVHRLLRGLGMKVYTIATTQELENFLDEIST